MNLLKEINVFFRSNIINRGVGAGRSRAKITGYKKNIENDIDITVGMAGDN